ncbi:MAG: helix-turn-helix domain-containing protein [Waterburya sp.]
MSDRSINLNQTEAFAQILPSAPQLSSHQTGWSDFFLAYYQQHPGCESPKSIFRQHALEIIDSGFESSHERYIEGQHLAYRLQGGETCFCPANRSHWTKWDEPLSFTVITFELNLFACVSRQMYNCDRLELRPQWQVFDPTIQGIVQALKADLADECPAGKLYGESFGASLAVHLVKNFSIVSLTSDRLEALSSKKQQEVLDFIEAYLDTDIRLEDLAKIAGISKYYFCRLFKQAMQIPPHQYVVRRRIERAKELLKYSDLTIVEIALACGFAHQSHLSRHFKRIIGISPQKFRNS